MPVEGFDIQKCAAWRRGAPALVCTLGAFAVLLLALAFWTAWDAVEAEVALERQDGADGCWWAVSQPEEAPELPVRHLCVIALGGVPLRPTSLVREPSYLPNSAEQRIWFEDQAALYESLHALTRAPARLRDTDGAPVETSLRIRPADPSRTWPPLLPGLLVSLGLLGIGSLVMLRRPELPAARALFLFCHGAFYCLVISSVLAGSWVALNPAAARALYQVNLVGYALVGISLVQLMSWFPAAPFGNRLDAILRIGIAAIALPLLGLELAGHAFRASIQTMYAALGLTLVLMVRGLLRTKEPVQRLQMLWMLWGFSVPVLTLSCTSAPSLLFPGPADDTTETIFILSCIAGPIGIAVAIFKYRLLDIGLVIRRTLVGAVVVMAFLFIFNLGIAFFAGGLSPSTASTQSHLAPVLFTAVVFTFLLAPVQQVLLDNIDRFFFRNRFNNAQALSHLSSKLAEAHELENAARTALDDVSRAMEIERVVIALDPEIGSFPAWSRGGTRAPPDAHFWAGLRLAQGPVLRDAGVDSALSAWMAAERMDLLLPLRLRERPLGFMACSAPSGAALSVVDTTALANVAASLALAFGHALSFEALRVLNQQLEQRVQERTAELERARLQLYQAEKMSSVGLLAAGVAHELNTPLGAVVSSAEQLEQAIRPGESESIEQIARLSALCARAARRAADIVQNLRDFSRPSQKDPEIADLRDNIRSTMQILGPTLRRAKVELTLDLGEIPRIICFPALVNQVIANLALNAIQAMHSGGRLRIETTPGSGGGVSIAVEDDGPGIPAELRTRIFEPFFTTKGAAGGTGLGLALSFNIVKAHGGRIRVDERHAPGARFLVDLPPRIAPDEHPQTNEPGST